MRGTSRVRRSDNGIMTIHVLRNAILAGLVLVFSACTTAGGGKPLAWVDGTPITEDNLKNLLTITHRTEAARPRGEIDLDQVLNKLINERLIVQEAYRMGLDKDPWVLDKLYEYKLRESVTRLYKEEIKDKVSITDDDVASFYREQMEQIHVRQITVGTAEQARSIREQVQSGSDMEALARQFSADAFKEGGGDRGFVRLSNLPDPVREAVTGLKDGEMTPVIKTSSGYVVTRLEEKKAAPEKTVAEIRPIVQRQLRRKKEDELSRAVLDRYRKQVPVTIDQALLSSLPSSTEAARKEDVPVDDRAVVTLENSVLTVRGFYEELEALPRRDLAAQDPAALKDMVVEKWINYKLVDMFALRRHYEKERDFDRMLKAYEEVLLTKVFARKVIFPQIQVSDDLLRKYYEEHKDRYLKPLRYKLRQITVKDEAKAQALLNQLKAGADFSWLAKQESQDGLAEKGGDRGWVAEGQLGPGFSRIVPALGAGETSEVFSEGAEYYIIQLEAKSEPEYEEYERIREPVTKDYIKDTYDALWNDYAAKLRPDAEIRLNESALRALKERLLTPPGSMAGQ